MLIQVTPYSHTGGVVIGSWCCWVFMVLLWIKVPWQWPAAHPWMIPQLTMSLQSLAINLQWLDQSPTLSDQPPTHLGHWPTPHSLSQTLVFFYYPSLLDTLDPPCLHFKPWPLSLTSTSHTWLLDSVSDSCIVADMVGTPQIDLWGLPLCQVCFPVISFPCICYR